jgi:hypothetical protein
MKQDPKRRQNRTKEIDFVEIGGVLYLIPDETGDALAALAHSGELSRPIWRGIPERDEDGRIRYFTSMKLTRRTIGV